MSNSGQNIHFKSDELVKYYSTHRRTWNELYPSERWIFERVLKDMGGRAGSVLDVGCALGYFLETAQQHGWQTSGIDLSGYAVGRAQHHAGCDVHWGELSEVQLPAASFDVITLWDVVEHMTDPLARSGSNPRS